METSNYANSCSCIASRQSCKPVSANSRGFLREYLNMCKFAIRWMFCFEVLLLKTAWFCWMNGLWRREGGSHDVVWGNWNEISFSFYFPFRMFITDIWHLEYEDKTFIYRVETCAYQNKILKKEEPFFVWQSISGFLLI